jgi:hypothetical protein
MQLLKMFIPFGLRLFRFTLTSQRVQIKAETVACFECGLLWSEVDRNALRRTIDVWGQDYLRDFLGLDAEKKPSPHAEDLA